LKKESGIAADRGKAGWSLALALIAAHPRCRGARGEAQARGDEEELEKKKKKMRQRGSRKARRRPKKEKKKLILRRREGAVHVARGTTMSRAPCRAPAPAPCMDSISINQR